MVTCRHRGMAECPLHNMVVCLLLQVAACLPPLSMCSGEIFLLGQYSWENLKLEATEILSTELTLTINVLRQYMIGYYVIKGFKCKKTERLFNGERVPAFATYKRQGEKRLRILDVTETLEVLRALPSNRFEALSGDRKGWYSIRVNKQWCVCFRRDDDAHEVEIVDYH